MSGDQCSNKVLAAHLMEEGEFRRRETAEMTGHEYVPEKRGTGSPAWVGTERFDRLLENLDLVIDRWQWGRIRTYWIPEPEDGMVHRAFWLETRGPGRGRGRLPVRGMTSVDLAVASQERCKWLRRRLLQWVIVAVDRTVRVRLD